MLRLAGLHLIGLAILAARLQRAAALAAGPLKPSFSEFAWALIGFAAAAVGAALLILGPRFARRTKPGKRSYSSLSKR